MKILRGLTLLSHQRFGKTVLRRMLSVHPIPVLEDNYMYLLVDDKSKEAAVVDPVEPKAVLSEVQKYGVNLTAVLTTHHHWDHAGGNEDLVKTCETNGLKLKVYGGDDRIGALTDKVKHDNNFKIGQLSVRCLFTPCHTSGHICYYVTDETGNNKVVFTGDTLFIGGCGRFFEGNAENMHDALINILGKLPDDTKVYCGHEYTEKNLSFAKKVEAGNSEVIKKLAWASQTRKEGKPTVPSTIGDEKRYNPFMRVGTSEELKRYARKDNPIAVMTHLRRQKDSF